MVGKFILVFAFYFISLMIAVGIGKQMTLETASEIMGKALEKTKELMGEIGKNEQATDKTEETETP